VKVEDLVVANEEMPNQRYAGLWESIVVSPQLKERLLHHAVLSLRLRADLPFAKTALHGLFLLYGPPGTGKTTLARSLAQQLAPLLTTRRARLVEVNPHGLMSGEHGRSQRAVRELLEEHIPVLAEGGVPTVVVLDEVEAMAVARSEVSLQANPADVHRATDAVLAALDRNADRAPHILWIATSNFTGALDEAFRSRADAAIEVPLPDARAIAAILRRTLGDFADRFPSLRHLCEDGRVEGVAGQLVGVDGRRVRKLVTDAMARRLETARNPEALALEDLMDAATELAKGLRGEGGQVAAA
jgi:SpoVK/Ycf46/Vps4 family AAA+-type ATPase